MSAVELPKAPTSTTSADETKTGGGGGGGFRGSTGADDRAKRADRRALDVEIASFDDASKFVDKTFRCVGQTESLIDALKGLDPKLVSTMAGDAQGMFIRHVVQDGEIGLGSDTGKALFYRPGQYRRIGFGCSFERSVPTRGPEDRQHLIEWMDITYLSIPAGHVAVIQKGKDQYVIGPGRYLVRQPTVVLGVTNLNKLKQEDKVKVYTEEPVEKRDIVTGLVRLETVVKTKELTAGWREQAGAITFIRPASGFRYVTRSTNGAYNIGDTFKVMRSQEHFVRFLDYQKYSRTTKTFSFQSKDFQNVELRVQLSWRLSDGEQWLESAGGYEDIFDALEEKAQALFRDAVGSLSHEEALDQRKEGFEKLEKTVRPALQAFAYDLGGELVDVQIRELLFPVVLARQQELAKREQENKEKLLSAEREINLQKLAEKKATEQQNADLQRKRELAEQTANIERVEAQRELAKVIAKSEREKAQVVAEAERQKAQKAGEKELAAVLATKAEIEANSQAAVRSIQAKQEADARKEAADAEAHAIRSKASAEAEAALKLAQAKAEGVRLMGEAFRSNPDVFRLEMARIIAETERVKAVEIGRALSANPNALLPQELQRDLLRMKMGFQPEVPQLLTSADLLLPGTTKDALAAIAKKERDSK